MNKTTRLEIYTRHQQHNFTSTRIYRTVKYIKSSRFFAQIPDYTVYNIYTDVPDIPDILKDAEREGIILCKPTHSEPRYGCLDLGCSGCTYTHRFHRDFEYCARVQYLKMLRRFMIAASLP